jgi:hypothetical protein
LRSLFRWLRGASHSALQEPAHTETLAIPHSGPVLTLDEVKQWVERVDAQLPGRHSSDQRPTYGRSEDLARPHSEIDSAYHYVIV